VRILRSNVTAPVVVDLGTAQEEQVRELRAGTGQLVDEVEEVLRLVRRDVDPGGGRRLFVPIVAVYTPDPKGRDDDSRGAGAPWRSVRVMR
jgi:hypothetical protein